MHFKASIIIPTYNGAHKISKLLEALHNEDVHAFEIIIVVDGSTDDTLARLEYWRGFFPSFKIISQINGGRSAARNVGAKNANSELLIFFDDDMIPSDHSLQRHCDFHKRQHGLLCGHQSEFYGVEETDVQNYKAWLTTQWTQRYQEGLTRMDADVLFFAAANCSIPKAIFSALGGFNERLKDGEDYDLARRALLQGFPVYYDKNNVALHSEKITCRGYVLRQRQYVEGHKMIEGVNTRTETRWRHLKRVIYRIFALPLWVKLIDTGFFARWIAKPFRYRLYSIVIHALSKEYPKVKL